MMKTRLRRNRLADLLSFPGEITPEEASKSRNQPPDWRDRERALDIRASWIVEAPAGSGKTGLLIQRFLKLLAAPDVDEPEQVLAITFTLKATAEMRERVLDQLGAAALSRPVTDEFERQTRALAEAVLRKDERAGWGILENPRRLNLRTIDSVCAEIARSLPIVSGSGGRQSPVLDAAPMYREAARRTLMQLGGPEARLDSALRNLLLHRDGNLAECETLIAEMLQFRDQWGRLIPRGEAQLDDAFLDGVVLPKIERALDVAICQALTQLTRTMPAAILAELTEAAAEFAFFDGYKGAISPIAICAHRNQPPEAVAEHLEHWRALLGLLVTKTGGWRKAFNVNQIGFQAEKHHKSRLAGLIDELRENDALLEAIARIGNLPPARYPAEQWAVAKSLFRILGSALVELQIVFAERSACDFAELGLLARAALTSDHGVEDLTAALGFRTRHLLVDEMQDTSTSQYDLIERLTAGWDGYSQTIFLVGDPKQSIYRFRQARVERFVRAMHEQRLGDLPLGRLYLTANFRSQRRLVRQFNQNFSRLFPAQVNLAHPEEVPYVEARPIRDEGDSGGVLWHTDALDPGPTLEETSRSRRALTRECAREVRDIAAGWLRRPLPPGRTAPWKIAVLVRSRAHLNAIVAELKGDHAIPFRAVDIEALGDRQEVLDLLGLTRALLHPADRVAWFGVLHAPWCGLGLADLHTLAGADDSTLRERCVADLLFERGHLLSEDAEVCLARVWPVLDAAIAQRDRLPLAQWVERTWRALGGDAYLSPAELANALRYLDLLNALEAEGGPIDLAILERSMKRLYAEAAVHPGAVDLMTIHGSKGLEWDVVLVPALEKRAQADRGRLLQWMEVDSSDDTAAQVVLAPIVGKGEESAELNQWIRSVHTMREAAERKRLLYVACTRAREELHLFAQPDRTAKGTISVDSSSLLKAAWPVAESCFEDIAPPAAAASPAQVFDLAAAAGAIGKPPMLHRLPLDFDPARRFATARAIQHPEPGPDLTHAPFARPEGSFAARSYGNAVHAFLELAAQRLAAGSSAAALLAEIPQWLPRVEALLRTDGLAPAVAERLAQSVVASLLSGLADPHGQWILAPHPGASSEFALTGWTDRRTSVRLDRIFRAGPIPLAPGEDHQWIVDFKTTSHGREGLDEFMQGERAKYQPQLEAYARSMARLTGRASDDTIRIALYYPHLARLEWWIPS
jgi:ATP-dependent helicase/nuclease subunit A